MKKIFTYFILLIASSACLNASDWVWKHPVPSGENIRCVKNLPNVSKNCFMIGGSNGYLAVTNDLGETWKQIELSTTDQIIGIIPGLNGFSEVGQALAVTSRGEIYNTFGKLIHKTGEAIKDVKFYNGTIYILTGSSLYTAVDTNNWVKHNHGISFPHPTTICARGSKLFIGTMAADISDIFCSDDGGNTWNKIIEETRATTCNQITFINDSTGYALFDRIYYKTTDGGKTWARHFDWSTNSYIRCFFLDENIGIFFCNELLYTFDGGQTVSKVGSIMSGNVEDIDYNSDSTLIVASSHGAILRLTKEQILAKDFPGEILSDHENLNNFSNIAVSGQNVIVVGGGKTYLRSTDHGDHWLNDTIPGMNGKPSACGFFGSDTAYVLSDKGEAFRSFDGGAIWQQQVIPDNKLGFYCMKTFGDKGIIAGYFDNVYYTSDRGDTWQQSKSLGSSEYQISDMQAGENDMWLSNYQTLAHSTDGGATWNRMLNESIRGFSFSGSIGYAVGWGDDVYKSTDHGILWKILPSISGNYYGVYTPDGINVYAINLDGYVMSSGDGGENWTKTTLADNYYHLTRIIPDTCGGRHAAWIISAGGFVFYSDKIEAGIKDNDFIKNMYNSISVYPNPAVDAVRFNTEENVNIEKAEIMSISGSSIAAAKINGCNEIDVSNLPVGYYLIKFTAGSGKEYYSNFIKK